MDRITSDQAQVETSGRVFDLLRTYIIGNWNSEPNQQHQNHAKEKYRHIKRTTNCMMERYRSPAYYWLLVLLYVYFILNHTSTSKLNGALFLKDSLIPHLTQDPFFIFIGGKQYITRLKALTSHLILEKTWSFFRYYRTRRTCNDFQNSYRRYP